jgi:hypothetical protein
MHAMCPIRHAGDFWMTVEEKRLLQVYPDKIKRSVATTDRK